MSGVSWQRPNKEASRNVSQRRAEATINASLEMTTVKALGSDASVPAVVLEMLPRMCAVDMVEDAGYLRDSS